MYCTVRLLKRKISESLTKLQIYKYGIDNGCKMYILKGSCNYVIVEINCLVKFKNKNKTVIYI